MKNIEDIIICINNKAITSGLKREPILKCERTQNNKIKIIYTNGNNENFCCEEDCLHTLNAKYSLKLYNEYNVKEIIKIKKRNNKNFMYALISLLDSFVDKEEKMVDNLQVLKEFLEREISNIELKSHNEAYSKMRDIYKDRYLLNKSMFIYIDTVNKVFEDYFID